MILTERVREFSRHDYGLVNESSPFRNVSDIVPSDEFTSLWLGIDPYSYEPNITKSDWATVDQETLATEFEAIRLMAFHNLGSALDPEKMGKFKGSDYSGMAVALEYAGRMSFIAGPYAEGQISEEIRRINIASDYFIGYVLASQGNNWAALRYLQHPFHTASQHKGDAIPDYPTDNLEAAADGASRDTCWSNEYGLPTANRVIAFHNTIQTLAKSSPGKMDIYFNGLEGSPNKRKYDLLKASQFERLASLRNETTQKVLEPLKQAKLDLRDYLIARELAMNFCSMALDLKVTESGFRMTGIDSRFTVLHDVEPRIVTSTEKEGQILNVLHTGLYCLYFPRFQWQIFRE